jgi:hypothetical protein
MGATSTLAGTEEDNKSLKDKIGEAFDSLGVDKPEEVEKPKVVQKVVEAPEEEEEEEESDDDASDDSDDSTEELSEDEIKEARKLYTALKNPTSARMVATELARQYAVNVQPVETKADVKTAKKDIQSLVKEKLGPEFAFLGDKLSSILETALEDVREENSIKLNEIEQSNLVREVQDITNKLSRETKGESRKYEAKMVKLMDEFQPARGITTEKYIRGIYKMASSETSEARGQKKVTDKIKSNSKDVVSRLSSAGGSGGSDKDIKDAPKIKTPKDAVRFAMKQMEEEQGKNK